VDDEPLATERGREYALAQLETRRAESQKATRINNASLPAGSPMYFYCVLCGDLSDVLPEGFIWPPAKFCRECNALVDLGWAQ
jgi:hypothetical protein